MGFKEVQDLDCDTTISLGGVNKKTGKPNPTKAEGYFIGSKETPSKKSKSGIAMLHIFSTAKGNIGVWGKTDLDRKMSGVTPGVLTRITQSGKVPTPNGDMYKFKVEVDESQAIEVNLPTADKDDSAVSADSEATGYNDADSTDYASEDDTDAALDADDAQPDEVQAPQPKAPKAPVRTANPAAVQALLNKARAGKSSAA